MSLKQSLDEKEFNIFGGGIAGVKNEFFETKCRKIDLACKVKVVEASPVVNRMVYERILNGFSVACEGKDKIAVACEGKL